MLSVAMSSLASLQRGPQREEESRLSAKHNWPPASHHRPVFAEQQLLRVQSISPERAPNINLDFGR